MFESIRTEHGIVLAWLLLERDLIQTIEAGLHYLVPYGGTAVKDKNNAQLIVTIAKLLFVVIRLREYPQFNQS